MRVVASLTASCCGMIRDQGRQLSWHLESRKHLSREVQIPPISSTLYTWILRILATINFIISSQRNSWKGVRTYISALNVSHLHPPCPVLPLPPQTRFLCPSTLSASFYYVVHDDRVEIPLTRRQTWYCLNKGSHSSVVDSPRRNSMVVRNSSIHGLSFILSLYHLRKQES